ncbi:MAG TPA: hypothetical protein VGM37_10395 [Armatimonadota bacterium]|jgi:hypothetical protein
MKGNDLYWATLRALLAAGLTSVAPQAGEAVEAYKARLKAWIQNTGTISVVRFRIFGIPIKVRLGVGADIRDFLKAEIDKLSAETITDLRNKLTSAYAT